jgi:hypothetical protein
MISASAPSDASSTVWPLDVRRLDRRYRLAVLSWTTRILDKQPSRAGIRDSTSKINDVRGHLVAPGEDRGGRRPHWSWLSVQIVLQAHKIRVMIGLAIKPLNPAAMIFA